AHEEELQVRVAEGKNLLEVAQLLEQAGICKAEDVARAARDPKLAQELGVPGPTLEGYLFPDTYKFRPGSHARKVLAAMVRHFEKTYAELKSAHGKGAANLARTYNFGDREIVILASIVEKETAAPVERPRIAQVFLNRLHMPSFHPKLLETDPTIVYGCTAV